MTACFDKPILPKLLGGTNGTTSFLSLDVDSNSNIVASGYSEDAGVAGLASMQAIAIYISSQNTLKWAKRFDTTYKRGSSIAISPN